VLLTKLVGGASAGGQLVFRIDARRHSLTRRPTASSWKGIAADDERVGAGSSCPALLETSLPPVGPGDLTHWSSWPPGFLLRMRASPCVATGFKLSDCRPAIVSWNYARWHSRTGGGFEPTCLTRRGREGDSHREAGSECGPIARARPRRGFRAMRTIIIHRQQTSAWRDAMAVVKAAPAARLLDAVRVYPFNLAADLSQWSAASFYHRTRPCGDGHSLCPSKRPLRWTKGASSATHNWRLNRAGFAGKVPAAPP
jgi:hypothetical protein